MKDFSAVIIVALRSRCKGCTEQYLCPQMLCFPVSTHVECKKLLEKYNVI